MDALQYKEIVVEVELWKCHDILDMPPMGSSVSPILANLVMEHAEEKVLLLALNISK